MKRIFFFALAAMVFSLFTMSAMGQDERNKFEFFGGYSYLNTDIGFDEEVKVEGFESDFDDRFGSHGFEAAITGNFHRYVGAKFDFSSHSKTRSFSDSIPEGGSYDLRLKVRTNQFLGGLQFKDNKKEGGRVRPFAHVLAGVANQKVEYTETYTGGGGGSIGTGGSTFSDSLSKNSFAMVFGGGVDVHVGKRVDIRIFQFDFNPIFMKADSDFDIPSHTQKNFRISAGIVIH